MGFCSHASASPPHSHGTQRGAQAPLGPGPCLPFRYPPCLTLPHPYAPGTLNYPSALHAFDHAVPSGGNTLAFLSADTSSFREPSMTAVRVAQAPLTTHRPWVCLCHCSHCSWVPSALPVFLPCPHPQRMESSPKLHPCPHNRGRGNSSVLIPTPSLCVCFGTGRRRPI